MRTAPPDVSEDRLAALLADAWQFRAAELTYAPVGFGSHHWVAIDADGDRRFVTMDDLREGGQPGVTERVAHLERALLTAHTLHEAGLSFVVAPLPAVTGSVLCSLAPGQAVAVYPLIAGDHQADGDPATAIQDRAAVVRLMAQLHNASPAAMAVADVDSLELADRDELERALGRLHDPWTGGPFAEGTRELLAASESSLRATLGAYDRLADRVRARGAEWVVTHGEPKADNLLATAAGLRLVDWDTTLVAPAARDLWLVDSGAGEELALYSELTGRNVTHDELTFYRLRWDLTDITSFVRWFAGPHARTPDTEVGWRGLAHALRLDERWPHLSRTQ